MELETENTFIKHSQIHGEFCPLDTTIKILSPYWSLENNYFKSFDERGIAF